ncbi:MAG TPA: winged helix-turn-helix transcriptional regulator [Ktedonobacteraceae bacterium]
MECIEYSLTEKGEAFQAVLVEMYKWGHTWAGQPDESEPDNGAKERQDFNQAANVQSG